MWNVMLNNFNVLDAVEIWGSCQNFHLNKNGFGGGSSKALGNEGVWFKAIRNGEGRDSLAGQMIGIPPHPIYKCLAA